MAISPRSFVCCAALAGALSPFASPAYAQVAPSGERIQYARIVAKDYVFDALRATVTARAKPAMSPATKKP